ncbi:hypothetical protein HanPSC8_Chr01g0020941 [Helianthus annuus]|nr:hypothetical protein HanPSC8_Chr01g0020941 [Helianthus annuus]
MFKEEEVRTFEFLCIFCDLWFVSAISFGFSMNGDICWWEERWSDVI